jgi:tagaturonate reductase
VKLGARSLAEHPPAWAAPSIKKLRAQWDLPIKVLQFGEGNFLRAFVDWMLQRMNDRGLFGGRAVLVQPIAEGMSDAINAQDGLYTVLLRGIEGGEVAESREIVGSVSRCVNPYAQFDEYLAYASSPDLRFVVSNTTEAGIRVDPADRADARPAPSFPGKLTQLLYARFRYFGADPNKGLVLLPCELVERNGDKLQRAVLQTAESFAYPPEFMRWVRESCVFTNTLVDRIVTGYPKEEAALLGDALGYDDALLVAGEVFHSWVIEAPDWVQKEIPLREAGLDVTFTDDMNPYRERKVRILNGAHTMTVLAAYLAGKETVREVMDDPAFFAYVERGLRDEIVPTLALPRADVLSFASAVLERFKNPFIKHYLLDIALNSVSKYKARILGTLFDFVKNEGRFPQRLTFALAALASFYRGREIRDGALIGVRNGVEYRIKDDPVVLAFFQEAWSGAPAEGRCSPAFCRDLAVRLLGRTDFWDRDLNVALPGFGARVADFIHLIDQVGVRGAMERLGAS